MGVFSFFKKSKVELTDEQKKWNKMWDCGEKVVRTLPIQN